MEHDDMASNADSDSRTAQERAPREATHPTPPAPQGPPILSNGLELPRSSDC
jgi:hypothetical protein